MLEIAAWEYGANGWRGEPVECGTPVTDSFGAGRHTVMLKIDVDWSSGYRFILP